MTTTGTIHKNPTVGSSGLAIVATDLPCTPKLPYTDKANQANRQHVLGAEKQRWQLFTADIAGVQNEQAITVDGATFTIKGVERWPARHGRPAFLSLVIEETT